MQVVTDFNNITGAQFYYTTYALYNEGVGAGEWFACDDYSDADEMWEAICAYLREQQARYLNPEYYTDIEPMCTDYEGFDRSLYWEGMGKDEICRAYMYACGVEEHGALWEAWWGECAKVDSPEDWEGEFNDASPCEYENAGDYAYSLYEDGCLGDIPEGVVNYIDWDKMGEEYLCDMHWVQWGSKIIVWHA